MEIIIDGINVSECERHCSDNRNNPNMCYIEMTRTYNNCNPKEKQCNFYITSIEKQLKRKEQEYEKLRKYHNKCCEEFEKEKKEWLEKFNQISIGFYNGDYCNTEHCSLLKAKEQECQQIMDNYTELDMQRIKECKNLQAEIDDLKEWKRTVVDMFNRTCKCKYLNQEAALCGLSGKQCVAINECMYKKHQALVAIKKYCEDQNLKADFTACEILQIISEVLDEKEMGNNTSNKTTSIQS